MSREHHVYVEQLQRSSAIPPAPRSRLARVVFPPATVHDDRASRVVHLLPGQPFKTNLEGGADLMDVTGARIVGIDQSGDNVLEVDRDRRASARAAGGGESRVPTDGLRGPRRRPPVVLERVLTLIAIVVLAAEFAVFAVRRVRARTA